jgi:flagellar biosynthesis protein FliP
MEHQTIIQIIVPAIAIPLTLFIFQRFVNKAEAAKQQEEINWRESVKTMFDKLEKKVSSYCTDNHKEHDELFSAKNKIDNRVSVIETTHHQRGCNQPYRRREKDSDR